MEFQVFGCQPELSKVMFESVKAGQVIFEESGDTLSDGTAGGIEENTVLHETRKSNSNFYVALLLTSHDSHVS